MQCNAEVGLFTKPSIMELKGKSKIDYGVKAVGLGLAFSPRPSSSLTHLPKLKTHGGHREELKIILTLAQR
jgi:hypothetical protein